MERGQQLQSLAAVQVLHKTSIQGQTHCQQHQIKHRSAMASLDTWPRLLTELWLCELDAKVQGVARKCLSDSSLALVRMHGSRAHTRNAESGSSRNLNVSAVGHRWPEA
jgi:hypothetical protein